MKNKLTLIENILQAHDFSLTDCLPKEAEIKKTLERQKDYTVNKDDANFISNPWRLAASIKNEYKIIRYLIIGILIGWEDLAQALLNKLLDSFDWSKEDIKTLMENILNNSTEIAKTMAKAVDTKESLQEDIEKHEELNSKLFGEDKKLKPEVIEKINEIVKTFLDELKCDGIEFNLKDIILIGSNVSYNYTKDSDLDIHIVADTASLQCPDNLYAALYGAYRCIFNKNFDIDFYDIPVELFVETNETATISNGIYSVLNNTWIKEPTKEAVPEIDKQAMQEYVAPWEEKCKALLADTKATSVQIDTLIEDIYQQRADSLAKDGEYGQGNLLFKELRNKGYLDQLKDSKYKVLSKELSLESLQEAFTNRELEDYKIKLTRIAHTQPLLNQNGFFEFHNVLEQEADRILQMIQRLDFVQHARKFASGKYDFNHINYSTNMPARYFTITGEIIKKD